MCKSEFLYLGGTPLIQIRHKRTSHVTIHYDIIFSETHQVTLEYLQP